MKINFYFLVFILICSSCQNNDLDRLYVSTKNLKNPFFKSIDKGVRARVDSTTTKIISRSGENESDISSQIQFLSYLYDDIKATSTEKIKGLVITPTSSQGELVGYLLKIHNEGIPVVIVDTKINAKYLDPSYKIPFVGSSNYKGGEMAAKELISEFPYINSILILNGVNGQESAEERRNGFKSIFEMHNHVQITERTANWNANEANTIVSALLSNMNNYDAIFAANDLMALGAIQAYKSAGQKIPPVIGFDAIAEAKNSIKKKELYATIAQDPVLMGSKAIEIIEKLKNDSLSNYDILIPTKVIK